MVSSPWRTVLAHPLNLLSLGAPLALIAELQHWSPTLLFFASGIAIMPLARSIGHATEELAGRLGPTAGGLLNATFGNATELIIAIVALNAGLFELVKASLSPRCWSCWVSPWAASLPCSLRRSKSPRSSWRL